MQSNESRNNGPVESTLDEILTIVRRLDIPRQGILDDGGNAPAPSDSVILQFAKKTLRMREAQRKYLPASYFDEPALNILLDLFVAEAERRVVYVNDACIASHTPTSTALRWISVLVKDGFAARIRDDTDARRTILEITPVGHTAIAALLNHWISD